VREFKFRVFDNVTHEMYHVGDETQLTFGTRDNTWSLWSEDGEITWSKEADLMQYTGLKDKNGKEIYEGDIVKSKHGQIGEVIWENLMWLVSWIEPEYDSYLYEVISCDIIGNIYENPELLKG
jgi:uncharacterized phage protein (TIGR01671 family)